MKNSFSIINKTVTHHNIFIMLDDNSICQLDNYNYLKHDVSNRLNINIHEDLFWFTRLKVKKYKEGRGSFLMTELCKILDNRKITVYNCVNSYGDMSYNKLVKFYKQYGFKMLNINNGEMLRQC